MAATYEGGVVLGADSRTSSGSYVANKTADKITQLAERVYMCRSGSAADTQAVSAYVQHYLHQHKLQAQSDMTSLSELKLRYLEMELEQNVAFETGGLAAVTKKIKEKWLYDIV